MASDTVLCWKSRTTISDYENMVAKTEKNEITAFISDRFTERYVTPLTAISKENKSGFCTMAICCLMIEALESFWQGWPDTKGKSKDAFCSFFDRYDNLKVFTGHAGEFWRHVRCGILHQAETTGGWKVHRTGILFDSNTKAINATRFHDELKKCLDRYCAELRQEDWDGELWTNFKSKMKQVCKNCGS